MRINQASVFLLYSEIHVGGNDLSPFILKQSMTQRHKSLVITQRPGILLVISSLRQCAFIKLTFIPQPIVLI